MGYWVDERVKCKIGKLDDCERQSRVGCDRCPDNMRGGRPKGRNYEVKEIEDKEVFKVLLDSCGVIKSYVIARKLGIPTRVMAQRLARYQDRGLVKRDGQRKWLVNKEAIEELT